MTTDAAWSDLLSRAALGTERAPPTRPACHGAVGRVLDALPATDAADALPATDATDALLASAGVLGVWRRAASSTVAAEPVPPAPCVPGEVPCGETALAGVLSLSRADGRHAALSYGDYDTELVEAWLAVLRRKGLVLPTHVIPRFLETARATPALRSAIFAVLGTRGRWLATQVPAWSTAGAEPGAADWASLDDEERKRLLRRVRAEDPAAARTLIESTWDTDAWRTRRWFLDTLEDGLAAADEPLLERARVDRRGEVREMAVHLLAALPGSALSRRAVERATPLVRFARDGTPDVVLPETFDPAWTADGLDENAPTSTGVGRRASWAMRAVAQVPVTQWSQITGCTPERLVAAASGTEWNHVLHRAWTTAAARDRDPDWIVALAVAAAPGYPTDTTRGPTSLVARVRPGDIDTVGDRFLAAQWAGGDVADRLGHAVHLPGPWGDALSVRVLRLVAQSVETAELRRKTSTASLRQIALRLHVPHLRAAADALTKLAAADDAVHAVLEPLIATLVLRRTLVLETSR